MTYELQYNRDDESYTVFEEDGSWVGVFQERSHAVLFIKRVLCGDFTEA